MCDNSWFLRVLPYKCSSSCLPLLKQNSQSLHLVVRMQRGGVRLRWQCIRLLAVRYRSMFHAAFIYSHQSRLRFFWMSDLRILLSIESSTTSLSSNWLLSCCRRVGMVGRLLNWGSGDLDPLRCVLDSNEAKFYDGFSNGG